MLWPAFAPDSSSKGSSDAVSTFVVKLKPLVPVNAVISEPERQSLEKVFELKEHSALNRVYKVSLPLKTANRLQNSQWVEYIQKDHPVKAAEIFVNDPGFTTNSLDTEKQWWLNKMQVPQAWENSTGSRDVTVAVVDTGINGLHQDLDDGRVGAGYMSYCQIIDPTLGKCSVQVKTTISAYQNSDDNGHGTLVAGIIGAVPNNLKGITGITWKVRLMPVKVLDSNGSGVSSDVAAGIKWAVNNGADIINLSLGSTSIESNAVLNDAIAHAYTYKVLVVAAAGNDSALVGSDLDIEPVYPVCNDGSSNMILGVAAVDQYDRKANFSNFGHGCIDLVAFGTAYFNTKEDQKGLLSTYYDPSKPNRNDLYAFASGTSMAAPMVSAVAALLKSKYPDLKGEALRDRLIAAVDNIDKLNQNNCLGNSCAGRLGAGRLNAAKALQNITIIAESLLSDSNGRVYFVDNGLKRLVSNFVFGQRNFSKSSVKQVSLIELELLPAGPPLPPVDGTILKEAGSDPTVYTVNSGILQPTSYLSFKSYGFDFKNVVVLSDSEVATYRKGSVLKPRNGALFKSAGDPGVYFYYEGQRRLISYTAFISRGLNFTDVVVVGQEEIDRYPSDEKVRLQPPLDGTLIKAGSDPTIYVIEDGKKRALSASAFSSRGYQFSQVYLVSVSELGEYLSGSPIL